MRKDTTKTSKNRGKARVNTTRSIVAVRTAMIIGTIIYGLFGVFDFSHMPTHLELAFIIRIGFTIPLMALLIACTFIKGVDLAKVVFVFITILIVSINLLIAISTPDEHAYYVWFVGLIIGMIWLHNAGLPLHLLKILYAEIFILYNIAAIIFQKLPEYSLSLWLGNNAMLITSSVFSFIASKIEIKNFLHEVQLKKELSKAVMQREKVLHLISHDVKGPISSLRGLLLLHEQSALTPAEFQENSRKIIENLDSLQELLHCTSMWSFSRGETEFFSQETLSIHEITNEVVNLFQNAANKKGIHLINNVDPTVFATADRALVRVIMANLVINAIRLTLSGSVAIKCKVASAGVTIIVEDTGQGLDDELMTIIRKGLQARTLSNYSSKGFALLLCKELIEKQGGSFSLMTSPMKGTAVTFTLPATANGRLARVKETAS